MAVLKTIFCSTYPMDCHILKGRLESDGLTCFIYDENLVWVSPFKSVAIGGVKLKVPQDQEEYGKNILEAIPRDLLMDGEEEYDLATVLKYETERQNKLLELKFRIRNNPSLLDSPDALKPDWLTQEEFVSLMGFERKFQEWNNVQFKFTWQQFWYELFDFERSVFQYLRPRPVEYYLDKELVDRYNAKKEKKAIYSCPICRSENVSYGYAFDYKWDVLYLILSLLIYAPFPPFRKNCHCFDCGHNFKRKKS